MLVQSKNIFKVDEVKVLINKALECICCKRYNISLSYLKIDKKSLNIKNLFCYEFGAFMFKFRNKI